LYHRVVETFASSFPAQLNQLGFASVAAREKQQNQQNEWKTHCLSYSHKNVTFCLFGHATGARRFFKPIDLRLQFCDEFSIAILTVCDHPNDRRKEAVKHKAHWIFGAGDKFTAKH
jgi:hypothetical protein